MSRPSLEPTLRHILRHPMNYEERTTDVVFHRPDRDTRDTEQQTRADVLQESQYIADTFARVYANNRAAINDASPFNDSHVDHLPVPPEAIDGDEMHSYSDHASVDLLESSGENVADVNRLKNKGEMLEIANLSDSWEVAAAWEENWEVTRDAYMFTEKYLQRYGPHPATRPWSPRSSAPSSLNENQQGAAEQHVTIDEEQLRREKRKNYHLTPKKNRYANRRRF